MMHHLIEAHCSTVGGVDVVAESVAASEVEARDETKRRVDDCDNDLGP